MNNKCNNFRYKSRKGIYYKYCTILKENIEYSNCKNCINKEYKQYNTLKSKKVYKSKYKRDKNKISIMPVSGLYSTTHIKGLEKHHIIGGSYRHNSEEHGLFIWVNECYHRQLTDNPIENKKLKALAQQVFEDTYSHKLFMEIFKIDYIAIAHNSNGDLK